MHLTPDQTLHSWGPEYNYDIQELEHRLDRRLEAAERNRIGVTQLRRFLEQLLQRRYTPSAFRKQQQHRCQLKPEHREASCSLAFYGRHTLVKSKQPVTGLSTQQMNYTIAQLQLQGRGELQCIQPSLRAERMPGTWRMCRALCRCWRRSTGMPPSGWKTHRKSSTTFILTSEILDCPLASLPTDVFWVLLEWRSR